MQKQNQDHDSEGWKHAYQQFTSDLAIIKAGPNKMRTIRELTLNRKVTTKMVAIGIHLQGIRKVYSIHVSKYFYIYIYKK